ncbi:MAG: hypothetical protein QM654_16420 [Dysgonamonadaceae bacterium]
MKPQWDRLSTQYIDVSKLLKEFLMLTTEKKFERGKKAITDKFNKLTAMMEEFDRYIQPISPITIRMPFESDVFSEKWQFYKDFLLEQHQTFLSSRSEQIMLNKLKKWSSKSEEKAIEYLDFLIVNRYKKFFRPSDKQLSGEELPADETPVSSTVDLTVDKKMRV